MGKGYSASPNLAVESKELPVGPGVVGVYVSFVYVRLVVQQLDSTGCWLLLTVQPRLQDDEVGRDEVDSQSRESA